MHTLGAEPKRNWGSTLYLGLNVSLTFSELCVQGVLHNCLGSSACRCKPEQNTDEGLVLAYRTKCDVQTSAEESVCCGLGVHVHYHGLDWVLLFPDLKEYAGGGGLAIIPRWSVCGYDCIHLKAEDSVEAVRLQDCQILEICVSRVREKLGLQLNPLLFYVIMKMSCEGEECEFV